MGKTAALLLVLPLLMALCLVASTPAVSGTNAVEDKWAFKTPMPTSRRDFGLATANGKIYAIGGYKFSYLNVNEMYDPVTDTWTTKAPMPTPRRGFSIAVVQNKIYVMGGETGPNRDFTWANEVYDTETDTWETKSRTPLVFRQGVSANVVNGKIYAISGSISPWPPYPETDVNNVYDPETDNWTNRAPIPTRVYDYASTVHDSKIFVIGGRSIPENKTYDLTQIYDPEKDEWSSGAPVPTALSGGAAGATIGVKAPKRIYFFNGYTCVNGGGVFYSETVHLTQVYDPELDTWTTGTPPPTPPPANFSRSRCAVVNDLFYVIWEGVNLRYTPIGYEPDPSYDGIAPEIAVLSPENMTYYATNISLTFTVSEPVSLMRYELDGETSVEISGNTTLTGLSLDTHKLTVYAIDTTGNMGTSETIFFTTAEPPEPFPTTLVVASIITVVVGSVGLLVYFKKRKRRCL